MQQLAIAVKQEIVQRALVVHGRYSHVVGICSQLHNVECRAFNGLRTCPNSDVLQIEIRSNFEHQLATNRR